MVAPDRRRSSVSRRFLSSVRPSAGRARTDEPPPEMQTNRRSFSPASVAIPRTRRAASTLRASGIGMAGLEVLEPGGSFDDGPGHDHEPGGQPLVEDLRQRLAHGRRGLAEGDDEDAPVSGQVELPAADPDDVAPPFDALPDETPGIDGRQGGLPDRLGVGLEPASALRGIDHGTMIAQPGPRRQRPGVPAFSGLTCSGTLLTMVSIDGTSGSREDAHGS